MVAKIAKKPVGKAASKPGGGGGKTTRKQVTVKKTTTVAQGVSTRETKSTSPRFQQITTPKWPNVFVAAEHNDTAAAKHYIERDQVLVRMTDDNEKTVALIAAENVNLPLLKYVAENNQSTLLTYADTYGNTALQRAIEKGALEIVTYLVEKHNWEVTKPNDGSYGNTPIHVAAEEGQLEILKYFIEEKKGDPNVRNNMGDPPVFLAADRPNLDVIKYLVEDCKVDIMALNNHRCNILHQSAKRGDVTVPKYLLDERKIEFDINWRDNMNCTIVYTATRYTKYEFIHYIVTEHKADVTISDELGRTPLHIAAHQNNYPMCKFFIDHGGSLEVRDAYNNTPLQDATDPKIVGFLDDMTNVLRRERAERGIRKPRSVWPDAGLKSWSRRSLDSMNARYGDRLGLGFESEEQDRAASSSMLDSFLIVADTFIRYVKGSIPQQISFRTPLTPQEEILRRMDYLAIEAVNASLDFE